jgi:hypothetical protein
MQQQRVRVGEPSEVSRQRLHIAPHLSRERFGGRSMPELRDGAREKAAHTLIRLGEYGSTHF